MSHFSSAKIINFVEKRKSLRTLFVTMSHFSSIALSSYFRLNQLKTPNNDLGLPKENPQRLQQALRIEESVNIRFQETSSRPVTFLPLHYETRIRIHSRRDIR